MVGDINLLNIFTLQPYKRYLHFFTSIRKQHQRPKPAYGFCLTYTLPYKHIFKTCFGEFSDF